MRQSAVAAFSASGYRDSPGLYLCVGVWVCVNRMGVTDSHQPTMIHSWVRSRCFNRTVKWGHDYGPLSKQGGGKNSLISVSECCSNCSLRFSSFMRLFMGSVVTKTNLSGETDFIMNDYQKQTQTALSSNTIKANKRDDCSLKFISSGQLPSCLLNKTK